MNEYEFGKKTRLFMDKYEQMYFHPDETRSMQESLEKTLQETAESKPWHARPDHTDQVIKEMNAKLRERYVHPQSHPRIITWLTAALEQVDDEYSLKMASSVDIGSIEDLATTLKVRKAAGHLRNGIQKFGEELQEEVTYNHLIAAKVQRRGMREFTAIKGVGMKSHQLLYAHLKIKGIELFQGGYNRKELELYRKIV